MHNEINKAIQNRELFSGQEEETYHTKELYNYFCDNYNDPNLLFKLEIYGYYKPKYKWTKEQADWFIEKNIHESVKWSPDGVVEYYYDWGRGKNLITDALFHFPHLDHIIPASVGEKPDDRPENFRIRCKRLNESRGNINQDNERWAVIVDQFKDMDASAQQELLKYLVKIGKTSS
jgi:hypothetical protein